MGKSESGPRMPPPAGARLRARLSLLLSIAAAFLVVVFVFPVAFPLHIDVPEHVQFGSASSLMFEIANQNLTPVTNVEYGCEVAQLTLANGSAVTNANTLSRGYIPKIGGRHGVPGRCQTGYFVAAPLRAAEYRLTITYRPYPWPRRRTQVVRISAVLDGKGELTGWKVE